MKGVTTELLQQQWLHSHEEDSDTEMVFRPASFRFPPSRGRAGFDLRPNQSLVEIGIAPTDGLKESSGSWSLQDDRLNLSTPSSSPRSLEIVSASKDKLVVKK